MTPQCEEACLKMKEKIDLSEEDGNPITPEEAMCAILGTKSGYCKGMGYGPTPPSSRKRSVDSEIAYLREMNKRLSEDNNIFKEGQAEYERRQVEHEKKQAEYEKRLADADERLAASNARQEVFQKFMERMMAKEPDNI
ncbi:hypothetical protein LINPERPRIM_LOCUS11116 [Linum perenne]